MTVSAIVTVERVEIKLFDGRQNEPREVIRRQPILQTRWEKKDLLTLARQEVLGIPALS